MALELTSEQRALLRKHGLRAVIMVNFHWPDQVHRFCDDVMDVTWLSNTWVGASAMAEVTDIKGAQAFAAESVSITIDGNRLNQSGFTDPAAFFRDIQGSPYKGKRVDVWIGIKRPEIQNIEFVWPAYAGRINYMQWKNEQIDLENAENTVGKLEIVLDSLAARYRRPTFRTRSDGDQQELFPGDRFYQYVTEAGAAEQTLLWGKKGSASGANGGNGSGGNGGWTGGNPSGSVTW